jgi:electron transfer flavoprotein alpha/beta subunit
MIRVMQQGAAWTVVRDGRLMRDGAGAAVHKTRELAVQHALRLAEKSREEVRVPGESGAGPEAARDG